MRFFLIFHRDNRKEEQHEQDSGCDDPDVVEEIPTWIHVDIAQVAQPIAQRGIGQRVA